MNYRDFWSNYNRYYLQEGYIMVIQDVRGRWMSEGKFVDVTTLHQRQKTRRTLTNRPMPMTRLTGSLKIFPVIMEKWVYWVYPIQVFMPAWQPLPDIPALKGRKSAGTGNRLVHRR